MLRADSIRYIFIHHANGVRRMITNLENRGKIFIVFKIPKSKQVLQLAFEERRSVDEYVIDAANGFDEVI